MDHNRVVRKEFSKQAARFGDQGLTLSSQDLLDWIVDSLPLKKEFRVLDVAAGTGHLSRAIAPRVNEVAAIDLTPAMLAQAREEAARQNLTNIVFEEGNAERLPYETGRFDLVASRLALHHFEKPIIPLREMARVCKPDGRLAAIDLMAPEDPKIAETYNSLERSRDPSHTAALSITQMKALFADAGLAIETLETRNVEVDFQRWTQMTGTAPGVTEALKERLLKDLGADSETGMRPFIRNGALKFLQVWAIVVGKKASVAKRA